MSPEKTATVLALAAVAWPWAQPDETSVVVWAERCQGITDVDGEDAMNRIVDTDERPPSIARFKAVAAAIARTRESPALRQLPGPKPIAKTDQARRMAAVAAYWDAATRLRPAHDHKRGWENCPRCTTRDAFIAEHQSELDAILKEPA